MPSLHVGSSASLLAISLLTAAAVVTAAPSATAATVPSPASSFTVPGVLSAVAAAPSGDAWAVGSTSGKTLIVRWNGTDWKQVPSPTPGTSPELSSVAVVSARSAWAVGGYGVYPHAKTLIEHWNGTDWKQVPSPSPGTSPDLTGVAATSEANAWAVGSDGSRTLIEHWNGKAWKQVASPSLAGSAVLTKVAAVSARNAWAVGTLFTTSKTLILHWNGKKWERVASPAPAGGASLSGLTALSAKNAWAVGTTGDCGCGAGASVILHWNGKRWRRMASPGSATGAWLFSVTATSARNAWAAGFSGCGCESGSFHPLIVRWNGTAWKKVPSPNPASGGTIDGIAAASAASAWAVGASDGKTLTERWNGSSWK